MNDQELWRQYFLMAITKRSVEAPGNFITNCAEAADLMLAEEKKRWPLQKKMVTKRNGLPPWPGLTIKK